jgi:hypothetical protein
MTNSIFIEPSAHDVEHIEASLSHGSDYCCLKLRLSGKGYAVERAGTFEIYGPLSAETKFVFIAHAINRAFRSPAFEEKSDVS